MWALILSFCYVVFIIACIAVLIALYVRRPLRIRFGLIMLPACALVCAGAILQVLFPDEATLLVLYYFNCLMFVLIFTGFLFFGCEFTGRYDPLKRSNLSLILVMPVATAFSIATDPWLHLWNSRYYMSSLPDYEVQFLQYDPSFMNVIWTVFCFAVGMVIIYDLAVSLRRTGNRAMLAVFCISVVFCVVLNVLAFVYVDLMVMPLDGLTFTFVALFFYTSALVFGLFDIAPVARRKMLDLMKDAIIVLDSDGMVNDVNAPGLNLMGKGRNEVLFKRPDALAARFPALERLLQGQGDEEMEIGDGEGRTFEAKHTTFEYGRMRKKGRMLILKDVTERRRIEQRFREAETQMKMAEANRRYRAIIENQTEAIVTFDGAGRITFFNPVFERVFSQRGEGIEGARVQDLLSEGDSTVLWDMIAKATPQSPVFHFEHVVTLPEGPEEWIHWQAKVHFVDDGSVAEVQAAGINITEKKRNEAEYRAVVESQKEMIVRRLRDGTIIFANQAYSEFFGSVSEELVGSRFSPPTDESDMVTYLDMLRKLTPQEPYSGPLRLRVYRRGGDVRNTEWSLRGIFDHGGHLVEYQVVGNDITDRLRMEQELNKAQKLESLGVLAGGIAHDFNNLLASIVSNIEVAAHEVPPKMKARHRLDEAVASAMRARNLTQQLLTYSKGGKPVKEVIDLGALLRKTIEFTLTGTNVQAEYRIADDLWSIEADPFQVEQVINNLVINAVQAMPEGGRIFLKAANDGSFHGAGGEGQGRRYVMVKLTDQGPGIPPENLAKIFDPFFTTKRGGTGLGLATVQSIIRNHDGLIEVDSEIGLGTSFTIHLPSSDAPVQEAPGRKDEGSAKGSRVLIMDDEDAILDVLSAILIDMGHSVDLARTGEEAIEQVSRSLTNGRKFDLLIMDLTIRGGMGGKDAMREILKIDPSTRAMVSSGYSNDPVMADPQRYGFIDYLPKPYTIQDLKDKLVRLLGQDG